MRKSDECLFQCQRRLSFIKAASQSEHIWVCRCIPVHRRAVCLWLSLPSSPPGRRCHAHLSDCGRTLVLPFEPSCFSSNRMSRRTVLVHHPCSPLPVERAQPSPTVYRCRQLDSYLSLRHVRGHVYHTVSCHLSHSLFQISCHTRRLSYKRTNELAVLR